MTSLGGGRTLAASEGEDDLILQMRDISKTFGPVAALQDVTFRVRRGSVHAICGENGAGKSTLMKVLSGVYPAGTFSGEIVYEGERATFGSIRDSEAAGIVIIHQELALCANLSILENIYLGRQATKGGVIQWRAMRAEAQALLAKVGLDEDPDTLVGVLGVGKQQLVEIAKALSKRVKLLILDEPTASLNDDDSEQLLDLVRQLGTEGVTAIIISHKLNEIAEIADETTILRDGRTIETLPMRGPDAADEDRIIRGMVGRSLDHRFPEHSPTLGEELLRVENWTVEHPYIPGRLVADHTDLRVRAGEIVGIAGLMGAGRTELAMSLFGQQYGRVVDGAVYKRGQRIDVSTVGKAIRHGIAYVTEDRKEMGLNLLQTIRENISAAAMGKITRRGVLDLREEVLVAQRYQDEIRIKTASIESAVGNLSGGNQQKVSLAKWIYTDPDVLILDEPTRGIDVGAKYEIYQVIDQLADSGRAVIVISSEMPELIGLCDRIYTINEGRLTGELDRPDFSQEALMRLMTTETKESVA
ncbi:sugar ABC transporter ATP-binding protein [Raineyella fluvialis]|uniref:ATP-binding cassette domain-containing protein n=1 Tax=Raineyella fluvialis TaxID=2662261 RepID=A0A5Q2FG54_9ACTN|nr:sugar ABC transporter ATP-binding protein [Raineyella fluvialis]QGF23276.1 ATP-binding cassette domain-containing protein [Raineyella fluvialis]